MPGEQYEEQSAWSCVAAVPSGGVMEMTWVLHGAAQQAKITGGCE